MIFNGNETALDVLKRSTIHGLNHVSTSNTKVTRTFWLILFLIGVGGFSINLVFIAERYYSEPILTSYINEHEPFIWPDITFCNPTAPYSVSQNPSVRQQYDLFYRKGSEYFGHPLFAYIENVSEFASHAIIASSLNHYKFHLDDFAKHVELVGIDMGFKGIYMTNEFINSMEEPSAEDIPGIVYTQYSQLRLNIPCYTFQFSRVYSEQKLRSLERVIFLVRTNFDSYNYINSRYIYRGVFLNINLPNTIPGGEAINVFSGFNNDITLGMSRHQYNKKKSKCRDDIYRVEIYGTNLVDSYMLEGFYEDCKKVTSQEIYFENCHCYNPFLPLYKSHQVPPQLCLNVSIFNETEIRRNADCLLSVMNKFKEKSLREGVDIIEDKCLPFRNTKCEKLQYTMTRKNDMWIELWAEDPNPNRADFIEEIGKAYLNVSNNYIHEIKRNLAQVSIKRTSSYGDLVREDLEYPLSELISDIGGLMGLWIGLSVVGMFEVVEFLIFLCRLFIYNFHEAQRRKLPPSTALTTPDTAAPLRTKRRSGGAGGDNSAPIQCACFSEQLEPIKFCNKVCCEINCPLNKTVIQVDSPPVVSNGGRSSTKTKDSLDPNGGLLTEYVYTF